MKKIKEPQKINVQSYRIYSQEQPYRCPICGGNGFVPNGFYNQTSLDWSTSSATPEICRGCGGTGIVWG